VVVVVGGGAVVVVVVGEDVGSVLEEACDPLLSEDCRGVVVCVVDVDVDVEVEETTGAVLVADPAPVVAAEPEPGRSWATTTPMSAVNPAAEKAATRVRWLNRVWARSLVPGV
jgi:hypothetical protein